MAIQAGSSGTGQYGSRRRAVQGLPGATEEKDLEYFKACMPLLCLCYAYATPGDAGLPYTHSSTVQERVESTRYYTRPP